ncbi:MAG: DUF503 domain-containing protein [Candidatus Sumerlaeia bacterium]
MQEVPRTLIGIMHVELRLPTCNSLKEKRSIIRSCMNYIRRQWNIAIIEAAHQNAHRSAILALTTISTERDIVQNTLRKAEDYLNTLNGAEVVDIMSEIV